MEIFKSEKVVLSVALSSLALTACFFLVMFYLVLIGRV